MNIKTTLTISAIFLLINSSAFSQELLDLFGDEPKEPDYTTATFKTTRIVKGHSIETPAPGELVFIISHDFGNLNSGAYEFFGLDQSTIRLGLEYSFSKRLCLGIGRSSFQKNFDAFIKYKILRQSTGSRNMPLSLTYLSGISLNSLKWSNPDRVNYFSSRLAYTHQILLARKFSSKFSIQLSPTLIHRNIVATNTEPNDIFSLGAGGRYKLTKRVSLNAEYFYNFPHQLPSGYFNPFALGFDLETGGHVFQLRLGNSQGMLEKPLLQKPKETGLTETSILDLISRGCSPFRTEFYIRILQENSLNQLLTLALIELLFFQFSLTVK